LAEAHKLTATTVKRLARDISRHPVHGPHAARPRKLAEHFEVWQLVDLDGAATSLADVARPTGYFHHQIRVGRTASQYALSTGDGTANRVVQAVIASPLAPKLDDTVRWIDSQKNTRGMTARLLTVPVRLLHAVWLTAADRDIVVVVDKPGRRGPALGKMLTPRAFLAALRRGKNAFVTKDY
jgi:hypothetical protein